MSEEALNITIDNEPAAEAAAPAPEVEAQESAPEQPSPETAEATPEAPVEEKKAAPLTEEQQTVVNAAIAKKVAKQREAEREAEEVLDRAREEADRLRERGAVELEQSLDRRCQQAEDRIQQAEAKAIDEVRRLAVDIAIEATRSVLVERTTGAKADALIDDAIKELPDKIH